MQLASAAHSIGKLVHLALLTQTALLLISSTVATHALSSPRVLARLPPVSWLSNLTAASLTHAPAFNLFPYQLRSNINMAWRSSGASNRDLVENLWRHELITHPQVKEAFLKVPRLQNFGQVKALTQKAQVDRAHYAPSYPYDDSPQPIGHAATISAPHMHASAVEHLLPYLTPTDANPAPRALDIGSGSGYLTHVLAELAGPRGRVVGVEHIAPLAELGERNMRRSADGRALLESGRVRFRVGDGRKGWVEEGEEGEKWDAIHVGASAAEVHPELLAQLRAPGRMFIPVDDDEEGWSQHIWCVDKDEKGEVTRKKLFGVRYVPLTDPPRG